MSWLTDPSVEPGKRNVDVKAARVSVSVFEAYENRWDLMEAPTTQAPILLPSHYYDLAQTTRVGLPDEHPWKVDLPTW
ncbi:hypothetical protein [Galactobacter valiniphilus]|uniref:hypothetical protein n=1 Tax=Galactobacter valiniphilus TaxID=2676122 RepID=UPI003736051E